MIAEVDSRGIIRVWHVLSSLGISTLNGGLDERHDRVSDVLGKVGPSGHDGGQLRRRFSLHMLAYMLWSLRLFCSGLTVVFGAVQRPFKP